MKSILQTLDKPRIVVGVLGTGVLLFILFVLPASVLVALSLLAAWVAWVEWLRLHKQVDREQPFAHYVNIDTLKKTGHPWIVGSLVGLGIIYLSVTLLLQHHAWEASVQIIFLLGVLFGFLAILRKVLPSLDTAKFYLPNLTYWTGGLLYITLAFLYFLTVIDLDSRHITGVPPHYPALTFKLLLLVWGSDTAAYFSGLKWGNRKLCPQLSPKKTIEGLWGTLVWTGVLTPILFWNSEWHVLLNLLILPVVGVVLGLLAVTGDLFASAIKRGLGIKDFGGLLPGHGGILDRVDAFLFVSPFYVLLIKFQIIVL